MSPGWWGGGLGGEGPEEKQTIPNPVLVASQTVPGRLSAWRSSLQHPYGSTVPQETEDSVKDLNDSDIRFLQRDS